MNAPVAWSPPERAVVDALTWFVRSRRRLEASAPLESLEAHARGGGFDEGRFLAFARRHRVVPMVHAALRALPGDAVSGETRRKVRDEARSTLLFAEGSLQRLAAVSRVLRSAGIPHAAYKGPALAVQAYGDVGARTFGDLDLFVPRRALEHAIEALGHADYTFHEWVDSQARAWALAHMHHVTASRRSPFADAFLELHWMALPPMMRPGTPPIDDVLAGPLDEAGGVPVLPWAKAFPTIAEHHAKHGWSRLLYVVDCAVREAPAHAEPVLDDALGRAVIVDARRLADRLVAGDVLDAAPELLQRTWHAADPYQFEVGEAYLDLLDPGGAWRRRAVRFRAIAAMGTKRETLYAVARQAFLEASVARGRVFGVRPNDASPRLKALRDLFR